MEDLDSSIPIVSGEDLRQLHGRRWEINGTEYVISSATTGIDRTSLTGGSESWIVPLLDDSGQVVWRFKTFLKAVSIQKVRRIRWLCRQRVWEWSAGLAGAPRAWIDTRECGRPDGSTVDMAGYLMSDVPGMTWAEVRSEMVHDSLKIKDEWRLCWISQLLRTLVVLEDHGLVHGDLSPGNLVLSCEQPLSLTLIDFDSFVASGSQDEDARPCEGVMIGTTGYMPIDLERRRAEGNESFQLVPYSDRRARDMLLLELMCFDESCPEEDSVADWDWDLVDKALNGRELSRAERYFRRREIIDLPETSRASSAALARALGVSMAPAVKRPAPDAGIEPAVPADETQSGWDWAISSLTAAEKTRAAAKSLLWSVCMAEWMLLALLLPPYVVPLDGQPGWTVWLLSLTVKFLVGAAVMATGLWRTTTVACEGEEAIMVQLGRFQVLIPGSSRRRGSDNYVRHSAVTRLLVGAVLMGGVVLGVSRLSQV